VTQPAVSRRELLAISAHAGLGVLALSLGGGVLRPRAGLAQAATRSVREIRLETREVNWELAPGKVIKAMAYNGRVPGAEIRVPEGERVRKDSVDVDAHMGSVVLKFTAHNPGDWFFHCHKPMHMEGGMITLARIA
jgi:FtsP/CotA-like multicopper oxidase with cupredoxin domain